MKTTVKNKDIVRVYRSLVELVGEELPASLAFVIAKNVRDAQEQVELYEKSRMSLLEKYGEKDKEGNWVMEKDNPDAIVVRDGFWEEVNALDEQVDVELTMIDPEKFDNIEPRVLYSLMPILIDIEES